ncbi:uncharacterized protein Z518_04620 [Rhinocladiella mackenziei CBS 650.93]|uniref:Rhinocladiella mackenziei CBS 650.93 unplaced genomic scaffold supercont1.3, whole genome shotgun sequence n=1 Tax=Rhinocladiella mackenziei CBS 650.93 TaxID=1442369 RepID=A0A0D2ILM0_9EURO|nr:uncharacterized protein Z518_04620 [Rhinocladiella mackenziei CBS 650.93]KIX06644.1 hypothetical protein Z518_04620 [Rhinocladiella mackenziei CBS 650.93]
MASPDLASRGSFKGRTVIVTGGAGAVGTQLSLAFGKAGANVVVNDISTTSDGKFRAQEVVDEITAQGGSAVLDTNSVVDGERIVRTALEKFGRIDVIVNNAALARYVPFEEDDLSVYKRILDVNVLGSISLILAAWPHFKSQRYGRVVNCSSDAIFGMTEVTPYTFSKGAILAGTRALAIEGAPHGILVNCVAPTAYGDMMLLHLNKMDAAIRDQAKEFASTTYPPESNIPWFLALCHESSEITGEFFSLGAYSVSRIVLGVQDGVTNLRTMEECLQQQDAILKNPKAQINVPRNCDEFNEVTVRGKSARPQESLHGH